MGDERKKLIIRKKRKPEKIKWLAPGWKWSLWVAFLIGIVYLLCFRNAKTPELKPGRLIGKNVTAGSNSAPGKDHDTQGVYLIDLSKYLVRSDLTEEKMTLDEVLDSIKLHQSLKTRIAALFPDGLICPEGTKILILAEKEYPDIPVYIIMENEPASYEIISLKEEIPRYSKYKRQLSRKITKTEITITGDAFRSIVSRSDEELFGKIERVLTWKTDINRLEPGDIIRAVYEELYYKDQLMGTGALMALEWISGDKKFSAFLVPGKTDENGNAVYCTAQGMPLKEGYRKSPVNYGRVTSRFNPRRMHPKLHVIRPHNGTDFAAPEGSPILSIGDGVVTVVSYTPANGNYIKVRHSSTYETQYLHLSKFKPGLLPGSRVAQGDVIGYVGHTGCTDGGSHVCLRLWKNKVQVDFLKEKFPASGNIRPFETELFRSSRDYYLSILTK